MEQLPFFSIIIPTYNRAHIIENILEKLEQQSFKDFETIIVDNCSTDNIVEVLKPYTEAGKVHFIQHDKNYERAKSRNTGLENARGKFATLLDSDDTIFPQFLERAHWFVARNPTVKLFHSLYNIQYENGETSYDIKFPQISSSMSHIVNGNYLSCHAVFMEKEVYDNHKLDTNPLLTGHEDYEYWLRVCAHFQLHRLPEYNSAMIEHKGRSFSGFTIENTLQQRKYIINKFKKDDFLIKKYGKYLNRLSASIYTYGAVQSNLAKMYKQSRGLLIKALREDCSILFTKRYIRSWQIALFKINISG